MNRSRRNLCLGALVGSGALIGGVLRAQATPDAKATARVIAIQAKKFNYTPNRITMKKGETVVLTFTAVDFVHGFKIPDLNIRADLIPGQVITVRVTVDKAGEYEFLCDNFCGSGHEEMSGKLIVK